MRKLLAYVSVAVFFTTAALVAQSRAKSVRARLVGFQEVPALSTPATGEFRGKIAPRETELAYELEYSGLVGAVTQAHIHFGQRSVNGGIMIWLCGTTTNPGPSGTPTCPTEGKVSRTVGPADVIGPAGQGIAPGEFAEAMRTIREGVAYANVHSTMWPGGEIRGQIRDEDRD
jgi:hypothetical protein